MTFNSYKIFLDVVSIQTSTFSESFTTMPRNTMPSCSFPSGKNKMFKSKDTFLDDLAKLERFACRKGSLGFRGWKPRSIPIAGGSPLTDSDFQPVFEQKGVDMRVGLDIAEFANRRSVDRIILVTGDTDMIPAMKHARKAGVELVIAQLPAPARRIHEDLLRHADLVRAVAL